MDINLDKVGVSERLKDFGIQKFGSISKFARELDASPSSFQGTYLSGRSLPGAPLLAKLLLLGCDLHWLFFGVKQENRSDDPELMELRNKNAILELKIKNVIKAVEE